MTLPSRLKASCAYILYSHRRDSFFSRRVPSCITFNFHHCILISLTQAWLNICLLLIFSHTHISSSRELSLLSPKHHTHSANLSCSLHMFYVNRVVLYAMSLCVQLSAITVCVNRPYPSLLQTFHAIRYKFAFDCLLSAMMSAIFAGPSTAWAHPGTWPLHSDCLLCHTPSTMPLCEHLTAF